MRNGVIEMLFAVSLFPCLGHGQRPEAPSGPPLGSPPSFPATLSKQEKQHILDGRCNVITSISSMPQSLKDVFAKVAEHGKFELADPDQEFQVTDVSVGQLPSRRLILAGSCDGRWFVHYERGGRGLGDDVLIFRADSNGVLQF